MSTERPTPIEPQTAEALLAWLEAFPAKQIERRLGALLAERRELDVEIRLLQGQLIRYRDYLVDLGREEPRAEPRVPSSAAKPTGAVRRPSFPSKRSAILRLLREDPTREWRLAEIREVLTERGWLEDSPKARHALQVTILGMAKRGEVAKVRTGVYAYAARQAELSAGGSPSD